MGTMWPDRIEQTIEMRRRQKEGGGREKVERQHQRGKMTAWERVEFLLDSGTFHPFGTFYETRKDQDSLSRRQPYLGDGVLTGWGEINGRPVCVAASEFTVAGGSLGEVQAEKICRIQDLAYERKIPIVFLDDSGGARIEEGIMALNGYGKIFCRHVKASGVIPQIAAILGPCSGGACYSGALCDFIFMVKGVSQMCLTGPQVVEAVLGQKVTLEELGGSKVHSEASGVAHALYEDERSCLNGIRKLLGYLPENSGEEAVKEQRARILKEGIPASRRKQPEKKQTYPPFEELVPANPRSVYDIHKVIEKLLGNESFFEIQKHFAPNAVVGLGIFDRRVLGIVANQPAHLGGALDCDASDKITRFVRFCDCFGIPLLTLVDVPAFFPGEAQERAGIIRHGAKILYGYAEACVPKVTLILRKAYGGAYIAMNCRTLGADAVYAWPIAEIAVMGAEGAVRILNRKELQNAQDPEGEFRQRKQEYQDAFSNPFLAAKKGAVDEILLPEETIERLSRTFRLLEGKKADPFSKRHGNMPV